MTVDELIKLIRTRPEIVEFDEVMAVIDANYSYEETGFSNGSGDDLVINAAGTNAGSCRIFAFGKLNGLSEPETLACFGRYYRKDVVGHPDGDDHANIRTFMRHGWSGIHFDGEALLTGKKLVR